jgi:hypothetical protein
LRRACCRATATKGTELSNSDLREAVLTSPQQFLTAALNAVRLYGQPDLGVRLGRRLHVTSYGMFGYALLCSETLSHLHATAFKYHRLANGLLQFRLVEGDGTVSWELPIRELVLVPGLDEVLYRFLLCRRRLNFDPPCRPNSDPGMEAGSMRAGCGQV